MTSQFFMNENPSLWTTKQYIDLCVDIITKQEENCEAIIMGVIENVLKRKPEIKDYKDFILVKWWQDNHDPYKEITTLMYGELILGKLIKCYDLKNIYVEFIPSKEFT